jgi:hypothetical protein
MNTKPYSLIAWTAFALLCGFLLGGLRVEPVRPALANDPAQVSGSSEDPPSTASGEVYIPDEYKPSAPTAPTQDTRTLYYFPLDSNNHNTILFFYNTTPITATINLDFQTDTGGACLSGVDFDISPGDSARVSADSLDAGRPASWSNTIIYNMFDTCEIGLITMPSPGVQVEGYVAWTATDTYNPRDLNPHAPIRFSTDPYTIHVPALIR